MAMASPQQFPFPPNPTCSYSICRKRDAGVNLVLAPFPFVLRGCGNTADIFIIFILLKNDRASTQ